MVINATLDGSKKAAQWTQMLPEPPESHQNISRLA
jgi:hypothetical protein